ncbi:lipopolysaccharide transport system permease protein [Desulfobaculum xiamenense]|uniref:Transport permease protein n=1 Tax=Desulfobaculum xiamenense TaxID=995050 RepID=A0A846QJW9_9BACT|nr:ABC transporter permease [Desulfobaculum xiamenense]NJB69196.1 lipopolysaccharide transport system permease protein [Desulfobaculum xiamenense]
MSDANAARRVPDAQGEWTTVITPRAGWFGLDLAELWRYRDLVVLFVRRDFVSQYKQTVLGPAWFVIQPLLLTVVYAVIFGGVAGLSTDGLPRLPFYLCGVVVWRYFAECLTRTSNTFVANTAIFGKVWFPRLAVPVSVTISALFSFLLQFGFLLAFLGWYAWRGELPLPGPAAPLTLFLVPVMACLGVGLGLVVCSLTVRYRDLRFLVSFGVQLFMYATPIIYPLSALLERWRGIAALNPMAVVVEAFRVAWLGSGTFDWNMLAVAVGISVAVLFCGLALFGRVEKTFMDTV